MCVCFEPPYHRAIYVCTGQRGLEVRGDGARSIVPMDFHVGRSRRNRGHYSAGADAVRRPGADRSKVFSDRHDWHVHQPVSSAIAIPVRPKRVRGATGRHPGIVFVRNDFPKETVGQSVYMDIGGPLRRPTTHTQLNLSNFRLSKLNIG